MGPAAAGLRLLPAGAQLPLDTLWKFCASEFISFPCTGSRWHGAPCPLVVNTAGRLPALGMLRPGVRCFPAAVLGVFVLVSFASRLFGGCGGDPVAGLCRAAGSWHPQPPGRWGPGSVPLVCVALPVLVAEGFAARVSFSWEPRGAGRRQHPVLSSSAAGPAF